jgi:hypothetical protein
METLRRWANRDWNGEDFGLRLPSRSVRPIPTATLAMKPTERLDATKTEVGGDDIWSAVEKTESTSPRMKRRTGRISS